MPREAPVRAIWWISVVARRAPARRRKEECRRRKSGRALRTEIVVLLVRSDPEPGNHIAFAQPKCAVVITNANGPDVSPERLKHHHG